MASIRQGVHDYTVEGYQIPKEKAVREKLEWFRDQKLGFMSHFGAYDQLGMFESWPMSDGDANWSQRFVDWTDDPQQIRKDLFNLNRSFNPLRFRSEAWAKLIADSGFRYCLLTTKHHDGFCLWDTACTDYKTTSPDCPYSVQPHADIVRSLFDALRKENVAIGAYFSKADWHHTDYWSDLAHTTRNPTYDIQKDPERWERFVRFTQDQMLELGEKYGPLDILWLDAGWVCKANGQDIRLGEVVQRLRKNDPRAACGGSYCRRRI
ncbi:MAG: alpha-L-fucosidase [Eubacteriales bacterium]|nr:alpha-L-fucosidase [Eubacteriales bacterium]